ncbi:hypothetical protein C0993_003541 [Termitomyces sp. T159_Od127]|nr:hypothetical protein C0993_003541 [Termitomyces sp. T159_Od127]
MARLLSFVSAVLLGASSFASGTASPSDIETYLCSHNKVRAEHGADPLIWNTTLASAAQTWADGCVFQHSGGSLGPYGAPENLAAGTGSGFDIKAAIKLWTDEVCK